MRAAVEEDPNMAWDDWVIGIPTGGTYNAGKWIYNNRDKIGNAVKGPFTGETATPYEPDKDAYQYKQNAYFTTKAEHAAARNNVKPDMVNYQNMRQSGLESRGAMGDQAAYLRQMRDDPTNSVAAQQLRQGQDANMQQALALARSGQGGPAAAAAAQRNAAFQNAQAAQQTNAAAATLRAQESTAANAQLSQLLTQQRAMDLQAAGLDAQTALQQAQFELEKQQQNDQYALGLYGLGHQRSMGQMAGAMGYEGLRSQNIMGAQGINIQTDASRDAAIIGAMATAAGAAASGGGKSDIRSKQRITELEDENAMLRNVTQAFGGAKPSYPATKQPDTASLDSAAKVRPIAFSYTPQYAAQYGQQRRESGVDAASLEKAPGYRHTVHRDVDGLRTVNTTDLSLANTAHIAALAKKLDEIERTNVGGLKGQ